MASDAETREVEPEGVSELTAAGETQIVDVRTEAEHTAGHIAGAAHIPFDELPGRAAELDRSRAVVFYCQGGSRSAAAAEAFGASGWEAYTMTGGISEWVERGLPLEPESGEVRHLSGLPDAPASSQPASS